MVITQMIVTIMIVGVPEALLWFRAQPLLPRNSACTHCYRESWEVRERASSPLKNHVFSFPLSLQEGHSKKERNNVQFSYDSTCDDFFQHLESDTPVPDVYDSPPKTTNWSICWLSFELLFSSLRAWLYMWFLAVGTTTFFHEDLLHLCPLPSRTIDTRRVGECWLLV